MRGLVVAICLCLVWAFGPASAKEIVLDGARPIVEARINGEPVRLLVDPVLPDVLVLNPQTAERLDLRRVPIKARVVIEDVEFAASVYRPKIAFESGRKPRAFAASFARPIVAGADGAIGPGALPYDRVVLRLRADAADVRTLTFPLKDPDTWEVSAALGGAPVAVRFDLKRPETFLNSTLTGRLRDAHALRATGEVVTMPLVFDVGVKMQPVDATGLAVGGLALARTMARTDLPLDVPPDLDAIVVSAERRRKDDLLIVGQDALSACASVIADRKKKSLTLRCR